MDQLRGARGSGVSETPVTTLSGIAVKSVYGPEDIARLDVSSELGRPGEFPYTRGIHPDMYRSRLWTMRQFSGFATPEETNRRYHYLLDAGPDRPFCRLRSARH